MIQDHALERSPFPTHIWSHQNVNASEGEFLGLKPTAIKHKYSLCYSIRFNKQTSQEAETPCGGAVEADDFCLPSLF